jgi:hypothetical protein
LLLNFVVSDYFRIDDDTPTTRGLDTSRLSLRAVILNAVKDLRLPLGLPSGVASQLTTTHPQPQLNHAFPSRVVIQRRVATKDLQLLLNFFVPDYFPN